MVSFPFSTNDSSGNNGAALGTSTGAVVAAGAAGAAVGAEAQLLSISPKITLQQTIIVLLFISSSPLA